MLVERLTAIAFAVATLVPLPSSPARFEVGYRAGAAAEVQQLEARLGLTRVANIPQLRIDVVEGDARMLAELGTASAVEWTAPDRRVNALGAPNDPLWLSQWSPLKTHAPEAWSRTTGDPATVVAVVDTGVDPSQPDLAGRLAPGYDFVNGDSNPEDDNGHGTAVAGIVAAAGDNHIGVAGYCWRCGVIPLKALDANGGGFASDVARAVVWASDHGARVINTSLGGPLEDAALAAAAQYAQARGALLVAAAGNDSSSQLDYPAALPAVVSVGASNRADALYPFSNRGAAMAAPGENTTTALGGGYETFLGTSSAAPVVSGIAALLFSLVPNATPAEVAGALEQSATPIAGVTFGRIDAQRALANLVPPPPVATPPPAKGSDAKPPPAATVTRSGRIGANGRSYSLTTGAGRLVARLVVHGGSGGRSRLSLFHQGRRVATAGGESGVRVQATVRRGRYRLVISGPADASFVLKLRYPRGRGAG
ncbi:MAG TPA: S8 family serine peptidase [Gaiellaceae bacterium]|nr:S8 family serine peptidase [Gaiellaceae bacterium]